MFICFSLIPIIILGLAQSGRAGLIYSILTVLIGVYINFLVRNKANIKFLLLYVIILSVFILLIFILGRIHRYGLNFDLNTLLDSVNSITSYTFGGISGFANYIDLKMYESNLTFGSYAFSGLYQFLGLSIQEPGLYNEYVSIDQSGNITNLYTGFRPFIDDFGFIGAFSFFSFFGFLSNIFYSKFMAGYLEFLGPLIWIYLWIMLLPFVTITIFNSYLAALFLPFILIKFCLKK
jgi:oligosaccharide repeat unit polymerase